uniref:Uncharacterized protein n=1 Tax=Candidatus Kentrum sp. TUN TaxID=2126343 RepID=A0A450ZZ73_9GAMM|nr:MAG: hypothetical protein BECKTUN1418F_GA0071002_11631 [Candidatus Kentron sp. TUN]
MGVTVIRWHLCPGGATSANPGLRWGHHPGFRVVAIQGIGSSRRHGYSMAPLPRRGYVCQPRIAVGLPPWVQGCSYPRGAGRRGITVFDSALPRRGYVCQPRVAAKPLPWVIEYQTTQPQRGCVKCKAEREINQLILRYNPKASGATF